MRSIRPALAAFGLAALLIALPASAAGVTIPWADTAGADTASSSVVINEFAPRGSGGLTDEFVELRNTSSRWVALNGWELWSCLSHNFPTLMAVFGADDEIAPEGYLLLAHVESSTARSDFPYDGWEVPDNGGWLLHDRRSGLSDGVGLRSGVDCTEADPAPQCDWAAGAAVTRDEHSTDTDSNTTDFACRPRTPGA